MAEEFEVWLDDAPVLLPGVDGEFDSWIEDSPVLDTGDVDTRRRDHLV
jgi:hypothetical protein